MTHLLQSISDWYRVMPSGLQLLFMVQHLAIELVRHCINRRIQTAMSRLREQVEARAKNSPFCVLAVLIN